MSHRGHFHWEIHSPHIYLFTYNPPAASPTIKLLNEDPIVVNPGQTVTLVCVSTGGEPTPVLTWVRNGDELPAKSVLKSGTLTIPGISVEEAGVYSCVADNNVGNQAKKSSNIVVRGTNARVCDIFSFLRCLSFQLMLRFIDFFLLN